jgi:hypothetical protein
MLVVVAAAGDKRPKQPQLPDAVRRSGASAAAWQSR